MTASRVHVLLAPFAIEAVWIVLFAILPLMASPRPVYVPPEDVEDDDDATTQGFARPWMRWIWLAYVVYHFPVVVPTAWLNNDTVPGWLLRSVTPVLYAGVLYLLFVR